VERGFSTLKNPDVIGMTPGLYRIRGRIKMSLLVACMWVGHHLHLAMVDAARLAKGWSRPTQTPRRLRRVWLLEARPAKIPGATSEDSRAP
jgi:hypothetical protein